VLNEESDNFGNKHVSGKQAAALELRKSFARKQNSTLSLFSKSRQKKVTFGLRKRSGQLKII
jgi:hypothetical protein